MKVLFHIGPLSRGGAERVVILLAESLEALGHDCTIVTSFIGENEYPTGVKRISLFRSRRRVPILRLLAAVFLLRRNLKAEKPDVAVSFMYESNFRLLLASMFLRRRCPVVLSVRNDPAREYPGRLVSMMAKTFFRMASGVVFQTDDARLWFPESVRRRSVVLPNPIEERFYRASGENRKDIVAVGRLTVPKNHRMLLDAFSRISDKVEDNLYIYGEGDERRVLEDYCRSLGLENRVFFKGCVNETSEVLSGARLFVLPSNHEGLPNALMEAMASGVPCISTDCPCGGPRELFGDELKGNLVPVGDADALAEKMLELLTSPERLEEDGLKARNIAERFRRPRVVGEWEKYLKEIASK